VTKPTTESSSLTPAQAKQIVMQWKRAAPLLEKQREADIRAADTVREMQVLAGMFNMAIRDQPPRESSGMVEMQRWFMRAATRVEAQRRFESEGGQ